MPLKLCFSNICSLIPDMGIYLIFSLFVMSLLFFQQYLLDIFDILLPDLTWFNLLLLIFFWPFRSDDVSCLYFYFIWLFSTLQILLYLQLLYFRRFNIIKQPFSIHYNSCLGVSLFSMCVVVAVKLFIRSATSIKGLFFAWNTFFSY